MNTTRCLSSFKFFIAATLLLASVGPATQAQEITRGVEQGGAKNQSAWVAYQNAGKAKYFNPVEFFKGLPADFPEMELINSKNYPELKSMAQYLESVGVPVMVGNEGELDSFFDLYLPTIARSPTLDPVPLGPNPNAEVGNLYLLHHDFAHHFAGIPGIRLSDLKNKEATRKLIIDIVLWKEVFATSQSSSWYIPKYWEWRENPKSEVLNDFRRYAQGYYTGLSPLTPSEHVDLVKHFVFGETKSYISLLSKKLTPASLKETRRLGVPRVIPDLAGMMGVELDARIMAYVTRLAEPIHSYFRPVGHLKFVKYCEDYADMLLQDWYVKWSEDFEVGVPLKELHERTLNLIEQTRSGKPLQNPAVGSTVGFKSWEFSLLKTEMTLLGRKFREVIHANPDPSQTAVLEAEYEKVVQLYRHLKSETDFAHARSQYLKLISHLEANVSIDRYVPWANRSRDASYKNFWRNPYAVIWKRGDALNNANAAHLSTKRLQHAHDLGEGFKPKRRIEWLQKEILDQYRAEQNRMAVPKANPKQGQLNARTYGETIRTLEAFVEKSLKPQFPYLSAEPKILLEIEYQLGAWLESVRKAPMKFETFVWMEEFAQQTFEWVMVARHGGSKTKQARANQQARHYLTQIQDLTQLMKNLKQDAAEMVVNPDFEFVYTSPPIAKEYLPGHMVNITRPGLDPLTQKPVLSPPVEFKSVADWISTQKVLSCEAILQGRRVAGT